MPTKKIISSVKWTTLATAVKGITQLILISILSRILSPSDFGLMAIVNAIIAFTTIFSDLGIGSAIIHKQDISQKQLSSLYWLNLFSSLVITFAITISSSFVSNFYHEQRLVYLLPTASIIFLINASYQQLRFRSEKELKFNQLALIEITAALSGLLSAISSAYLGAGAFSLIIGTLTTAFITAILSWIYLAAGWRPSFSLDLNEIRSFLSFSTYMIGNGIVSCTNQMADIFIGGKLLSTSALGIYSLPRNFSLQIALLINPIVTRIAFPLMAKAQNDPTQLKYTYLKTMFITASLNFPIYIFIFTYSTEVSHLIFGEKIIAIPETLRILALWGLVRSTGNPVGSLLLAIGKPNIQFYWNLSILTLIVLCVYFGSLHGSIGIAYSMLLCQLVLFIPCWYFLIKNNCQMNLREYIKNLLHPLLSSVIGAAFSYVVTMSIDDYMVKSIAAGIIMLIAYCTMNKPKNLLK